jgi:hypothetical protein
MVHPQDRRGAAFHMPVPRTIYYVRGVFRPNRVVSRGSPTRGRALDVENYRWRGKVPGRRGCGVRKTLLQVLGRGPRS